MRLEVCKGHAGLALYVDDVRVAGPRHNGVMTTVLSTEIANGHTPSRIVREHTVSRIARLETALVAHNDLLRSAFQATQRDAVHEVRGTILLADAVSKALSDYRDITNEARAAQQAAGITDA